MNQLVDLITELRATIQDIQEALGETILSRCPKWVLVGVRWGMLFLSLSLIGYIAYNFKLPQQINQLELKAYDTRVRFPWFEKPYHPSRNIIILDFDTTSITLYEKRFGGWPWSHQAHQSILSYLNKAGVKHIHYLFPLSMKNTTTAANDAEFSRSLKRNPQALFAIRLNKSRQELEAVGNYLTLSESQSVIGRASINVSEDADLAQWKLGPSNILTSSLAEPTYNHWRATLPVLETSFPDRLSALNLNKDEDGVFRSAPLVQHFEYRYPLRGIRPYHAHSKYPQWLMDSQGRPVNDNYYVVNPDDGTIVYDALHYWMPSSYFKSYLTLKNLQGYYVKLANDKFSIGTLQGIPLFGFGRVLPYWFNNHQEESDLRQYLQNILVNKRDHAEKELQDFLKSNGAESLRHGEGKQLYKNLNTLKKEIRHVEDKLLRLRQQRNINDMLEASNPYYRIPVWRLLQVMEHEEKHLLSEDEKGFINFLKDKIAFVGLTAEDTGKEVISTPLGYLDLVTVQSILFDNLYQNIPPMMRAPLVVNLLCGILLGLMTGIIIWFNSGILINLVIKGFVLSGYCFINLYFFKSRNVWLDLFFPIIVSLIFVWVVYILKSIIQAKDFEKTYQLATKDGLTGLYNHRYFKEQFDKMITEAFKKGEKFSLCLIDIDFFKKFNDTYGHQAGDEVLRCVAKTLTESVRDKDLVARYGGEEIAVLLRNTDEHAAQVVAQKLVDRIGGTPYKIAKDVEKHVTISVGYATYPSHGRTIDRLIQHADEGLYSAKENGRNQVGIITSQPKKNLQDLLF
jgi:diguanylate cyclase (GGDEF)-like protein